MRKIKNPKIGQYVLLTRWGDKSMNDPWQVGILEEIRIFKDGKLFKVENCDRYFKHCFNISIEEASERLKLAGVFKD
jgi:hypothetical protein